MINKINKQFIIILYIYKYVVYKKRVYLLLNIILNNYINK